MVQHLTEVSQFLTRAEAAKKKPGIDGAGVRMEPTDVGEVIDYFTMRAPKWWEFWKKAPVIVNHSLRVTRVVYGAGCCYYEGVFTDAHGH